MRNKSKMVLSAVGLLIICVYLFPIYWMINSSFKKLDEIFAPIPTFFPQNPTVENFVEIFSETYGFNNFMLNSVIVSTSVMILTLLLCAPAAYALARKNIKGLPFLIGFVLIIQMFPASVLALPIFSMLSRVDLVNTIFSVILATMTISMPFCIVVLRTFFISLPKDLESAAMVDGCSAWGTFLKIMVPISKTGIMTCAAFSFVFAWGEFMYSLVMLNDKALWTVTLGMRNFEGQYGTQWGPLMAAAVVCSLPVIIIFLLAQKYVVSGVTAGSVKG